MPRPTYILFALAMLLLAATPASAGYQADYTMTVSMDDSAFGDMAAMFGEQAGSEEAPEAMEPVSLFGKIYWVGGTTRIDMFYDPAMASDPAMDGMDEGDIVESYIITAAGDSYRLIHNEKRAVIQEVDAPDGMEGMPGMDMPDLQPDRMVRDYRSMIEELNGSEGMVVTELPDSTINGVAVKGVSFIMDMSAMMEGLGEEGMPGMSEALGAGEDGEMEGMEDFGAMMMGLIAMMGNIEGEIWYSEDLDVMMRMDMSLMGMATSMELDSIFDWTDNGSTFVVPDDYELITQQEYMQEQMEMLNEMYDSQGSASGKPAEFSTK